MNRSRRGCETVSWKKNLRVLKEVYPDLAARVEAAVATPPSLDVMPSASGWPTARWRDGGGYIHSSVDPWQEARRLVETADIAEPDVLVVLGLGLGYHLLELYRRFPRARALVVVEPDVGVLRAAMECNDLERVFGTDRVHWGVGLSEAELRRLVRPVLDTDRVRSAQFFQHPASLRRRPTDYLGAAAVIRDVLLDAVANLVTVLAYGADWLNNHWFNIGHVVANPGVQHLFGRFHGKPAIIVSAGPSLDKNVHLLAEAKGRAVILCVDTALKALLRHGIHPDFVLSIDGSLLNYRHFEGVDVDDVRLVAEPGTHYRILDEFRGPKLIASFDSPTMRWLESFAGEKGFVLTGGSVATFAFPLAMLMGADPIIFVGQDLSYPDGKFYASGTYYADNGYRFDTASMLRVPANDGGEVVTPRNMYTFLKWFEDAIACNPERTYINATEGGARIQGTRVMTLREALERYCREPVPVAQVLAEIPAPRPDWDRLLREMDRLERRRQEFLRLGRRGERLARRLQDLVGRDYVGSVPERVNGILAELDRIDRRLRDKRNKASFDIVGEVLQPLAFSLTRAIKQRELAGGGSEASDFPQRPEERQEIAGRSIALYAGVTAAAEYLAGPLKEAMDRVRRMAGAEVAGCGRSA